MAPFAPNFSKQAQTCKARRIGFAFGADYGGRTRYLNLGKVALYQMS